MRCLLLAKKLIEIKKAFFFPSLSLGKKVDKQATMQALIKTKQNRQEPKPYRKEGMNWD